LTNDRSLPKIPDMIEREEALVGAEVADAAETVQRCYPQVYFACHVRHTRRRSTAADLSAQDSVYLGHLRRERPTTPRELARHLGVAGSTLSAFVKRMTGLGYVERGVSPRDRREAELWLTAKGEAAMRAASILDLDRLRAVLTRLGAADRRRAVDGLSVLADACRAARAEHADGQTLRRRRAEREERRA